MTPATDHQPPQAGRATTVLPAQGAEGRETKVQQVVRCPACGYPTLADMGSCPSCGTPLPKQADDSTADIACHDAHTKPAAAVAPALSPLPPTDCQQCGQPVEEGHSFCPHCGARVHRLTVRRIVARPAEPQPRCALTLIPEEDEHIEPREQLFEGKTIVLNRENTEPANRTITSAQQAELTCEDGCWYIADKSALQSTFVRPARPIELQDGDIIMLGDRLFRFSVR